ncbi:GNAT family N-acetyltransferase [Gracilibacillus alcaliphilus]|uniref:GNAT family N-acetyltransferase n=1 Tax=Gracilibacillus alcaliphilus TaxID=1401441 RepID=UPI00195E0854|nr:GNAT family protein [Gracilibacillus alcaliphilus]MBM7676979.1 RimJ/RimL family protein N-acetyltransferase [Gracilibacillus alcaliphilus]
MKFKEMDLTTAQEISQWVYSEPYSIYNMDTTDEAIEELLNGFHFALHSTVDDIIGYYCIGKSAQVPAGHRYHVYDNTECLDLGLGLHPNLTGSGLGLSFVKSIIKDVKKSYPLYGIRLTVALFNQRAITVYKKAGFEEGVLFSRKNTDGRMEFMTMFLKEK